MWIEDEGIPFEFSVNSEKGNSFPFAHANHSGLELFVSSYILIT